MNPESNNQLMNPGTPSGAGMVGGGPATNGIGGAGLSMADSLASAEDNLTSAGLAANNGGNNIMGLDQLGSTNPEAMMTPPDDAPLVPAAPVPGSIGSVTSVPPAPAAPVPAPGFGADSAAPAAAPFNPFAPQPANDQAAPSGQPLQESMNSSLPPVGGPIPAPAPVPQAAPIKPAKNKAKLGDGKSNILTIILAGLALIFLISTIVMSVLYVNAINNPKIVYMPTVSNGTLKSLSCSRASDFGFLAGYEGVPALGTETVVANYVDDKLNGISFEYEIGYTDADGANIAKDALLQQKNEAFLNELGNAFDTDFKVDGNVLVGAIKSKGDSISESVAQHVTYGSVSDDNSIALSDLRTLYEGAGYVCVVE